MITATKLQPFFVFPNFFLTFFRFWRLDLPTITNFVFTLSRVQVVCWSWSCVRWSPDNHTHEHTYARTRTRTGIFRP